MKPKTWLITGVAGFIGSHLMEELLKLDQIVVGVDNFSTGKQSNIKSVLEKLSIHQKNNFRFIQGDITDTPFCLSCCRDIDIILHQAALGSVPASIEDPIKTNVNNITGTLSIFEAARKSQVKRVVYASSSAVYGENDERIPLQEGVENREFLSPYALTKYTDELYAALYSEIYGIECIGLRYFNVFGARQDPNGAYAAVIPIWVKAIFNQEPVYIYGDGETVRDFCSVRDVVQANLLAALTDQASVFGQVFNVGVGSGITLNQLFSVIQERIIEFVPLIPKSQPVYRDFREGDIRFSIANIEKIKSMLGYLPIDTLSGGLDSLIRWYLTQNK